MNYAKYCYSNFKIPVLKNSRVIQNHLVNHIWCLRQSHCINSLNIYNDNNETYFQNTKQRTNLKNENLHYSTNALQNTSSETESNENTNILYTLEESEKENKIKTDGSRKVQDDAKFDDCNLVNNILTNLRKNKNKEKDNIFYKKKEKDYVKKSLFEGPGLKDFINSKSVNINSTKDIPYLQSINGNKQKVYLKIYGCQMNVSDAEVINAILTENNYEIVHTMEGANIVLLLTCAIRDSAEQKIWHLLEYLKSLKERKLISKIGLLGCMAERLKHKIIEEQKIVDVISGPDSYKDLPRLLSVSNKYETAINVSLSYDETYADVTPVRLNPRSKTAFVTIMRGCDNMCTYCIVPFTRGREKARPISSILDEVQKLSDQGIKEVTLLGQNVNSYRDLSQKNYYQKNSKTNLAKGFHTVYKTKEGGLRFSDLLDKVSLINSEMRIRFTSPHPKDFPDEVLHLIAERSNICQQIHLPAQSGNSNVLERMRRGYTREAYIELVQHIRSIIPKVALSSDFIVGFCNETEEEFKDTLSLVEEIEYSTAYLFAYSMREKTTAYRRYVDDISSQVKNRRLQQLISLYRTQVDRINKNQIGHQQLVLVEGESKKSVKDLQGRNDGNIKVIFPSESIPISSRSSLIQPIKIGDYIVVQIYNANSQVLKGIPLYHSSIKQFFSSDNEYKKC